MAEFQRYQRSVSVTPGGVSTAQAQGYQSLANRLKSFANQQHAYADQEHNNQIDAYASDIENDIIESVGRLSIENSTDFNSFSALVSKRKEATVNAIDHPVLKQRAALFFDQKTVQYGEKVYRTTFEIQQQVKQQNAIKDIDVREIDTQSMVTSAIRNAYESGIGEDEFVNTVGPLVQEQRAYITSKFQNMPALGTKEGQSKKAKKERNFVFNLYKTAVLEEALINEENGGSGVSVLFDFDKNPSEFFNSRPHLKALFPESELQIQLTEQEQNTILIEGAKKINIYTDNQERLDDQKTKLKEAEWAKQHTFMLDQIVTSPGLITTDMVIQSYKEGDLGKSEHDSLLKILQSDSFFKDDPATKVELNNKLYDPEYDPFLFYANLMQAVNDGQISPATQMQYLKLARSGTLSDVTKTAYYSQAMKNIESNLRTTGPLSMFTKPTEDINVSLAQEVLFDRVASGENPRLIWKEILLEFDPGWNTQTDGDGGIVKWNPNWVGSSDSPNIEETQRKLAKQLESKQISEKDYLDQFDQIEKYNSSLILRKSRQ